MIALNAQNALRSLRVSDQGSIVTTLPANAAAITPDDDNDLSPADQALYAAAAGTVAVTTVGGQSATFTVAVGDIVPVRASRVLATGTTATVLGLY